MKCWSRSVVLQLINAALDISALFDARKDVVSRATRFTSKAPPARILDALERSITANLGGSVKRRGDCTRSASLFYFCMHHTTAVPKNGMLVWSLQSGECLHRM